MIGVTALPGDITSTRAAHLLATSAESFGHEISHHPAASAIMDNLRDAAEEIVRLNDRTRRVEKQLRSLLRNVAPDLLMLDHRSHPQASAGRTRTRAHVPITQREAGPIGQPVGAADPFVPELLGDLVSGRPVKH